MDIGGIAQVLPIYPANAPSFSTTRSPQRHEFLGRRRVNPDRGVEVGLGGPGADGDTHHLHDLRRVVAHHVSAKDAAVFTVDDQLHHDLAVAPRKRVKQRPKRGAVHVDRSA